MFSLENTFLTDRECLIDQYVNAWHNEEAFARHDALTEHMHAFAKGLQGLPHPVIKAKTFAYLCESAPIYNKLSAFRNFRSDSAPHRRFGRGRTTRLWSARSYLF